jgi:hypothetical protein
MSVQEEYLRIINQVTGGAALKDLEEQLKAVAAAEEEMKASFTAGNISLDEMKVQAQGLAAQAATVRDQIDTLTKSTMNFGDAAFHAVRATADLQHGFRGVPYHIQALTTALGGPVGLGVALSGVAFAAYEMYENWDKITEFFRGKTLPTFDTARTNLDNLGKAIKTNKEELEKLGDVQKLSNEQLERYNFLTERAERLTRAQTKSEEEAKSRRKETMAEEGKPEISKPLAEGLAGLAPAQVAQMRRGLAETNVQKVRDRIAGLRQEIGSINTTTAEGFTQYMSKVNELATLERMQPSQERRIQEEAKTTVGQALGGDVGAFGRVQAAAAAQPFRFSGLEGFLGPSMQAFGVTRPEDLLSGVPLGANAPQAGANLDERRKALAVRRQRDERERARQEDAMATGAENRERARQRDEAQEARRKRAAEREESRRRSAVHREVGAEMSAEGQAERAGSHYADQVMGQMAKQMAHATGRTVENQRLIMQNSMEAQQLWQMLAQEAAQLRRMIIQQQQQTRRQREEVRSEQRNGDSY